MIQAASSASDAPSPASTAAGTTPPPGAPPSPPAASVPIEAPPQVQLLSRAAGALTAALQPEPSGSSTPRKK